MQSLHEVPRQEIERTIEALIAYLDALDGDPEMEPWLGSIDHPTTPQGAWAAGGTLDLEGMRDRDDDSEPDADDEPTLGWVPSEVATGNYNPSGPVTGESEPSLGWTDMESRYGRYSSLSAEGLEEQHDAEGSSFAEHAGLGPKLDGRNNAEVFGRGADGRLYLRGPDGHLYAGEPVR